MASIHFSPNTCDIAYEKRAELVNIASQLFHQDNKSMSDFSHSLESIAIAGKFYSRRSHPITPSWIKRSMKQRQPPKWLCQAALRIAWDYHYVPKDGVQWYWFIWLGLTPADIPLTSTEEIFHRYPADYLKETSPLALLSAIEYYWLVAKEKGFTFIAS